MKRLFLILLAVAVSTTVALAQSTKTNASGAASNQTAVSKQGREMNLASNTALAAQLENSLDARRAKVGDKVVLKTTKAVKQNGEVVVPKGARLLGRVTDVQQHSKANGESRIGVAFDRLQKGALDIPITASIVSITQARSQARTSAMESETMSSSTTTARSSGGGQGGLLGGVGNTVGGVVNTTTSTVGSATRAVGSTVGTTAGAAGNLTGSLRGLQISQATEASAEGGSTLSLNSGNLRLESGTTFNLLVSSSTNARAPQ